jgi:type IV secretory pathway VirB2 component (pilin)
MTPTRQKGRKAMNHSNLTKDIKGAALMVGAPLLILGCMAAMNGGTALSASAFDSVVTTLRTMLTSSWLMMLAIIVLVVAVWQLAHGGGYKTVGVVIGVLAVALVGPTFLTTVSTSMPTAAQIQEIQQHKAELPKILMAQK